MSITPGMTITCPTRSGFYDLLQDNDLKSSHNQQQTCVTVRKSDPPARSWIVRWNHDSKESVLTTVAITKCLKTEMQNRTENVMEIDTEIHPQPVPAQGNAEAHIITQNNPILLLKQLHAQISEQLLQYQLTPESFPRHQPINSISIVTDLNNTCQLQSLTKRANKSGKRKYKHLRCSICSKDCSFCCSKCSTDTRIVALCGPNAKRDKPCFVVHLNK